MVLPGRFPRPVARLRAPGCDHWFRSRSKPGILPIVGVLLRRPRPTVVCDPETGCRQTYAVRTSVPLTYMTTAILPEK